MFGLVERSPTAFALRIVTRLPCRLLVSMAHNAYECRRSTRVPLKVTISLEEQGGSRTCDGETIVINLHGALLATKVGLRRGMRISIHVYVTDKRAAARVVFIDPENPLRCGIELAEPRNIWGVPLPPADWQEEHSEETRTTQSDLLKPANPEAPKVRKSRDSEPKV